MRKCKECREEVKSASGMEKAQKLGDVQQVCLRDFLWPTYSRSAFLVIRVTIWYVQTPLHHSLGTRS